MQKIGSITVEGNPLNIFLSEYKSGAPAVRLNFEDGSLYATVSADVPEVALRPGEVLMKAAGEYQALRDPMLATGLFTDTGGRVEVSDSPVSAQIWRIV